MRRFLSLRDFDWTLLGFVMMLSIISVLEIYSATLHTKFHGFQRMQILWIVGGLVAMFIMSVIDYHKLLSVIYWIYGFCLRRLVAVLAVGTRVNGGKRWIKLARRRALPAVRVGEAGADRARWPAISPTLPAASLTWKDIFKAIGFRRAFRCCWF